MPELTFPTDLYLLEKWTAALFIYRLFLMLKSGNQGELLRQQYGEQMQLEQELAKSEQEAYDSAIRSLAESRRKTVDSVMESLSLKLQGELEETFDPTFTTRIITSLTFSLNLHEIVFSQIHKFVSSASRGRC